MKSMSLCHLYSNNAESKHIGEILNSFDESISIDIDDIDTLDEYGIYIVYIEDVTKEVSEKLKSLFALKVEPLVYFILPKTYSLTLFQLAFILKAKTIITQKQDTQKVIKKIKADFENHKDNYLEYMLGKSLVESEDFLFFKNKKLVYATQNFLEDFRCENLSEVEKKILPQIYIDEFLSDEISAVNFIDTGSYDDKIFFIKSISLSQESYKVISFEPYIHNTLNSKNLDFVSSRTSFVELLKDKILERDISRKNFSIISIQVENSKSSNANLDKIGMETLLKEMLGFIETILDKKLILAQFNMEFYVTLFEDMSFEELKNKAQKLYVQLREFISKQKLKPMTTLFVLDTNELELNDILVTLDNICLRKLSKEQIQSGYLKCINDIHTGMSEREIIDIQLQSAYLNGTEFKLLNIYKGLCINTSSKIIKKTDDTVHIEFESMQGILMSNEKETVLQSSENLKDIKATVKYVDMQRKFAILNNFKLLNTNANSRQYSRVTCSTRTPIVLSSTKTTLHGEILDISINSIAIKTKLTNRIEEIKSNDVLLSFILPSRSHSEGFVKLDLKAKALFCVCDDISCKIICELYENSTAEAIIMEYVYNRQKELIIEVKKMVKSSSLK